MSPRFPLIVQFEMHPDSSEAKATAEFLHGVLNADPSVPGLQVPTCFTPEDGSGRPPEPRLASEADRVIVVLLADDHLAVNTRRPPDGQTWGDYAVALRTLCDERGQRFVPVQLTEGAFPIDARLRDTNFLRAWAIDDVEERRKFIARRLVHAAIRRLLPRDGDEDAPPVTIFLSHTKIDLKREPGVVKALLAHLNATQPEKTWFDSGDIDTGSRFGNAIERGVADAALLAVITDAYSSRAWCRREVLFAKHLQRPVVIVDAVQEREIRRFPYAGNAPVIRWKESSPSIAQDVVDLLLRETLRHAYAKESLERRKLPGDDVLPAGPELVTIVHREKSRPVLYPDPPLGPEELAVLAAAGVRVETPLERHARAHDLHRRNAIVALSVSEAEDLARYGLRVSHLDAIFLELSRYLLLSGVRLAYGGHLQSNGYTLRLADLLYDPIVEQLRGDPQNDQGREPELITHQAWPRAVGVQDEVKLGILVDVRRCERPPDIDEALDPAFVPEPNLDVVGDSPIHRFARSRGLTTMRERQTKEVTARVIVGGRLGPAGRGYTGRMPGVLEEALISLRTKRPLYLVGAFAGCARLVFDALEGVSRPELTWAFQSPVPHSEALRQLYRDRGQPWDDYEAVATELAALGVAALHNGLTDDENRELATTRSGERIIELILHGLQQLPP